MRAMKTCNIGLDLRKEAEGESIEGVGKPLSQSLERKALWEQNIIKCHMKLYFQELFSTLEEAMITPFCLRESYFSHLIHYEINSN